MERQQHPTMHRPGNGFYYWPGAPGGLIGAGSILAGELIQDRESWLVIGKLVARQDLDHGEATAGHTTARSRNGIQHRAIGQHPVILLRGTRGRPACNQRS